MPIFSVQNVFLSNTQSLRVFLDAPFYWKLLIIGIVNAQGIRKNVLVLQVSWITPAPPTIPYRNIAQVTENQWILLTNGRIWLQVNPRFTNRIRFPYYRIDQLHFYKRSRRFYTLDFTLKLFILMENLSLNLFNFPFLKYILILISQTESNLAVRNFVLLTLIH